MASLVAFRSAIRASRVILTCSRAVRRSTASGLSALDLAWAACSSWAFLASAAVFRRSAKLVVFDLIISTYTLMVKAAPGSVRLVQIGGRRAIFQGMDETKVDKLARLSGRLAWKVVGALERRGYDIR
jgi:hypothetical protein